MASLTLAQSPATKHAMADDLSQLSFEDALKRLEAIVHRLESGDASLDESISLYSEGDKLRGQCDARLKDAQMRIDKISFGNDGAPTGTAPFDAN
jgi:exodeoxyribonuclease VII small subunit